MGAGCGAVVDGFGDFGFDGGDLGWGGGAEEDGGEI